MQTIFPIPALKDNYIWALLDTQSNQAWVVDPGDATPVITTLSQKQLILSGILITHHHWDHSNGIPELLNHFGKIPVVGSYKSPNPHISHPVKESDTITCFDSTFKAIEIPGHTLDHTAYYNENSLFCGDTLFSAGCGKIFEGTPEMMYHSLQKLFQLNDETQIYCGHEYTLANLQFAQHVEPHNEFIKKKTIEVKQILQRSKPTLPSILTEEKNINPFLRCQVETVIDAVEKFAGKKLNTPVDIFSHLREWKNGFR